MTLWWRIWFVVLAIKLALGIWLPLTPDEAYYWIWGKNLQLSYYDHPPMVAWLMWLGEQFPKWGVRIPGIILGQMTLLFWRRLLTPYLAEKSQIIWLVLASLMPLIGPGSLIVTPDIPLLFSWSLSLWLFQRLIIQNGSPKSALLLGMALGLGILSKYQIVLIGPVLLGWWYLAKPKFNLTKWLPLTVFAMVVVSTPVWLWNWQNDFASIRFQLSHGLGRPTWKPSWTYEYVLVQIGLIFPTLFWLAARASTPTHLRLAAWIPLGFFFLTSFRGYVEGNWPIVAHPAVLALAVIAIKDWRMSLKIPLTVWALTLALVLGLSAWAPWPDWVGRTKLGELRSLDAAVENTSDLSPLFAPSYQIASLLSFRQNREVYKLRGMNRRDFFDSLPGSSATTGHFFIVMRKTDELPEPWKNWQRDQVIPIDGKLEVWELHQP